MFVHLPVRQCVDIFFRFPPLLLAPGYLQFHRMTVEIDPHNRAVSNFPILCHVTDKLGQIARAFVSYYEASDSLGLWFDSIGKLNRSIGDSLYWVSYWCDSYYLFEEIIFMMRNFRCFSVTMTVQSAAVEALLTVSPFNPHIVANLLKSWKGWQASDVPAQLGQKMEAFERVFHGTISSKNATWRVVVFGQNSCLQFGGLIGFRNHVTYVY